MTVFKFSENPLVHSRNPSSSQITFYASWNWLKHLTPHQWFSHNVPSIWNFIIRTVTMCYVWSCPSKEKLFMSGFEKWTPIWVRLILILLTKRKFMFLSKNKDGCFCITTAWLKDTFLIEQFCFSFYIVMLL